MTVHNEPSGSTRVTRRLILAAIRQALAPTALTVTDVTIAGLEIVVTVKLPANRDTPGASRSIQQHLGYPFWIDLGLADHRPTYQFRA